MESYRWAALEVVVGLNPLLGSPAPREDWPPSKSLTPRALPHPGRISGWILCHHTAGSSLFYPGGPRPSLAHCYLQVCTS